MFDWTLFDNSNQRSFVRWPSKVGMFDSDLVWLIWPKNRVKENIFGTKLMARLCSINVNYD